MSRSHHPATMSPPSPPLPTLLLLFSLLLASPASAWKKEEFRDCNQTPFCKRARTRAPHSIPSLSVASLSLSDGSISALLLPSQPLESPSDSPPASPRALTLRLSVYTPGALRLEIDEDYSDPNAPSHRRFRVPDVLLPDIDDRHKLYLPRISSDSPGITSFYLPYGFEVRTQATHSIPIVAVGRSSRGLSLLPRRCRTEVQGTEPRPRLLWTSRGKVQQGEGRGDSGEGR